MPKSNPLEKLEVKPSLNIAAPMVRYSKLPFRQLTRFYGADLCFTPMILADVFKNSQFSREAELSTCKGDDPLVVQFAASNSLDAADAAELVAKYVNGVDINCGCPQTWAIKEGIGSYLISKPELVADIIDQVKRRTSCIKMTDSTSFPCSIKIRIDADIRKTIDLCKRAEMMGCDWITVHGRVKTQKNEGKADLEAIRLVKENVNIPIFANGGAETWDDVVAMQQATGANGVMVAQGILANPALFSKVHQETPLEAVKKFVELSVGYGSNHFIMHHHLMYMLESQMNRSQKKHFNSLYSIPAIIDYLSENYQIEFF